MCIFISLFEEKQTRRPRCLILTTSWSFAPPRRAFFYGYCVLPVYFVFYGPTIKRTTTTTTTTA